MDTFTDFSRRASVPEHLEHYVRAVSTLTPIRLGPALGWRSADSLVLVSFPPDMFEPDEEDREDLDKAVQAALALDWVKSITVLAPFRPAAAPKDAVCSMDACWAVDLLAPAPEGKVANMLRRAAQEVEITVYDTWTSEHEALVAQASARLAAKEGDRRLSEESALLFSRLGDYVRACENHACCYSARRHDSGTLCGFVIGDHCSYTTSFYLFAFRAPDAPSGTADALLKALLDHSAALGQRRCNLGLGIHDDLRFFKKKWGAKPALPFIECAWKKTSPPLFSRLSGLFGRKG